MQKDKDAIHNISIEIEKMKAEGVAYKKDGTLNLSEIKRRTGYPRKTIRRLMDCNLELKPHGNSHEKDTHLINGKARQKAEELLMKGVTNSTVIMEKLVELGYTGGLTTVKNFIKANKDLVPARRLTVQLPQGKVRRYATGPGEMFQMDWGFVKVVDRLGKEWKCFLLTTILRFLTFDGEALWKIC